MRETKRLYKNFLFSLQLIYRQGPNELSKTIIQKFSIFVTINLSSRTKWVEKNDYTKNYYFRYN